MIICVPCASKDNSQILFRRGCDWIFRGVRPRGRRGGGFSKSGLKKYPFLFPKSFLQTAPSEVLKAPFDREKAPSGIEKACYLLRIPPFDIQIPCYSLRFSPSDREKAPSEVEKACYLLRTPSFDRKKAPLGVEKAF